MSKPKNSSNKPERRILPLGLGSLRAFGEEPKLDGYAAVFNQLSDPLARGSFREKIDRGAFTNTIKVDDIKILFNHDDNFVMGRLGNDTLMLEERQKGLYFENIPPDTVWAKDVIIQINRGDVYQCSFQFRTIKDAWDETDPQNVIRTLVECKLYEISVGVPFPAYPQTDVNVRSEEDVFTEHRAKIQGDLDAIKLRGETQKRNTALREEQAKNILEV